MCVYIFEFCARDSRPHKHRATAPSSFSRERCKRTQLHCGCILSHQGLCIRVGSANRVYVEFFLSLLLIRLILCKMGARAMCAQLKRVVFRLISLVWAPSNRQLNGFLPSPYNTYLCILFILSFLHRICFLFLRLQLFRCSFSTSRLLELYDCCKWICAFFVLFCSESWPLFCLPTILNCTHYPAYLLNCSVRSYHRVSVSNNDVSQCWACLNIFNLYHLKQVFLCCAYIVF